MAKSPTETAKKMRSVEATRAVSALPPSVRLKKAEHLVLIALAQHADANFECWPGVATIAKIARCSERNVPRITSKLRKRGLIDYDDNEGGPKKTNHYRLLFASNPDNFNPDKNKGDNTNPDRFACNPDKSNAPTLTDSTPNPDTALSGEWFESFKEWEEWFTPLKSPQGGNWGVFEIRQCWQALSEIEDINPEELLKQITAGIPVQRQETCDACSQDHQRTKDCLVHGHGAFTRKGYRFGNWIAWEGRTGFYGPGWSHDSGCVGCRSDHNKHVAEQPERFRDDPLGPLRTFELRTPAYCETHGNFILICQVEEYSEKSAKIRGHRFRVGLMHNNEPCPECEAEWLYEYDISEKLELSADEWERGKEMIMHGIAIARGWVNQ